MNFQLLALANTSTPAPAAKKTTGKKPAGKTGKKAPAKKVR